MSIENLETPVGRLEGYLNKLLSDRNLLELAIGPGLNQMKAEWLVKGDGLYFLQLNAGPDMEPVSPNNKLGKGVFWAVFPHQFMESITVSTVQEALEEFSKKLLRDGLNGVMLAIVTHERLYEKPYISIGTFGVSPEDLKGILLDEQAENNNLFNTIFSRTHFASRELLTEALEFCTDSDWRKLAELGRLFEVMNFKRFWSSGPSKIVLSDKAKLSMAQGLVQSGEVVIDADKDSIVLTKSSAS